MEEPSIRAAQICSNLLKVGGCDVAASELVLVRACLALNPHPNFSPRPNPSPHPHPTCSKGREDLHLDERIMQALTLS